mmetsp:Transcript_18722/g.40551  ORF Transcript_18722/g.40551 Transcript_18722/m.40551 type:complete len:463 (-) Transcript_18722:1884-3272(-)
MVMDTKLLRKLKQSMLLLLMASLLQNVTIISRPSLDNSSSPSSSWTKKHSLIMRKAHSFPIRFLRHVAVSKLFCVCLPLPLSMNNFNTASNPPLWMKFARNSVEMLSIVQSEATSLDGRLENTLGAGRRKESRICITYTDRSKCVISSREDQLELLMLLPLPWMGSTTMSSPATVGLAAQVAWTSAIIPALVGMASRRSQTKECVSGEVAPFLSLPILLLLVLLLPTQVVDVLTGSDSNTEIKVSKNKSDDPSGPLLEKRPVRSNDDEDEDEEAPGCCCWSLFEESSLTPSNLGNCVSKLAALLILPLLLLPMPLLLLTGLSESSAMISLPSITPKSLANVLSGSALIRGSTECPPLEGLFCLLPVKLLSLIHFSSCLVWMAISRLMEERVWRGWIWSVNRSGCCVDDRDVDVAPLPSPAVAADGDPGLPLLLLPPIRLLLLEPVTRAITDTVLHEYMPRMP